MSFHVTLTTLLLMAETTMISFVRNLDISTPGWDPFIKYVSLYEKNVKRTTRAYMENIRHFISSIFRTFFIFQRPNPHRAYVLYECSFVGDVGGIGMGNE